MPSTQQSQHGKGSEMGQAKQRGTFEERKELAVKEKARVTRVKADLISRRPSPKHTVLMAALAGLIAGAKK